MRVIFDDFFVFATKGNNIQRKCLKNVKYIDIANNFR